MSFTFTFFQSSHSWWLDIHASAIQAICAGLGLLGLGWYCWLTHGIHQQAIRQATAAIRPFIVIDELTERDVPDFRLTHLIVSKKAIYIIRNLGTGPAVNIQWTLGSDPDKNQTRSWTNLEDLAAGDWSYILGASPGYMFDRPEEGMTLRFSDVAENTYETVDDYRDKNYYQRCRPRKS
jgi:hypothetical protein